MAHDKNKFITPELEQQIKDETPDFVVPQAPNVTTKVICDYHAICQAKAGRVASCMGEGQRNCASYKFYTRYPDYLNQIGIGSKI